MSGIQIILSDAPVPASSVLECALDVRRGTFRYARDAREPRRLRAVGERNWMALADHQSRLYRFEYGGRAWRFDPMLRVLPESTGATVQIVPGDAALPVFSASYGPSTPGLVLFHWVTGPVTRWYTEGLGVWYGVGADFGLQSLLFLTAQAG